MATDSKYAHLYHHLCELTEAGKTEWRATFKGVEAVLGFRLPSSARQHRPWWANQKRGSRSQAHAWLAAGWETQEVNITGETLIFRRPGIRSWQ